MHGLVLGEVIKTCRERVSTDCPTRVQINPRQLEEAVVDLAGKVERLSNTCAICGREFTTPQGLGQHRHHGCESA